MKYWYIEKPDEIYIPRVTYGDTIFSISMSEKKSFLTKKLKWTLLFKCHKLYKDIKTTTTKKKTSPQTL